MKKVFNEMKMSRVKWNLFLISMAIETLIDSVATLKILKLNKKLKF